jgi:outer membrane receptor for ferrienterochelin and colicins
MKHDTLTGRIAARYPALLVLSLWTASASVTTIVQAQAAPPVPAESLATIRIRVLHDSLPIGAATIRAAADYRQTDAAGAATLRLGHGALTLRVTRIGFQPLNLLLTLRAGQDTTVTIEMEPVIRTIGDIVVSATRSERRVEDTPVRVEIIDEEEVAEKAAMTPGDIQMMLNETSGLRVATTSPSLGGANVRIQGLRGRYTLMLMDGLPIAGSQGGFGLLQIPPVDLARAEVIKGTASALYGSAAIGGVVNLVSRVPGDSPVREAMLNQTSRGGSDAIVYLSTSAMPAVRGSLLASAHRQREQDIDHDGWADMSGYTRAVLRPRLFAGDSRRSLFVTAGYTGESRRGGTIDGATAPDGAPYEEGLNTTRSDGGLVARVMINSRDLVAFRAAHAQQQHTHMYGDVREHDRHRTSFAEAALTLTRARLTGVGGVSYREDNYRNRSVAAFDFDERVPSIFGQLDVDVARSLVMSGSGRVDRHPVYGTSVSPRISALLRAPANTSFAGWTMRLSAGAGSFAPTPLTEETEATGLTPVQRGFRLKREHAKTASLDINGSHDLLAGRIELGISAYASRVDDPVAIRELTTLTESGATEIQLVNSPLAMRASGAEALARWLVGDVRLTATYALLRATEWDPSGDLTSRRRVPLAPRHTAGLVGSFERESAGRIGVEAYYTGRQALENNPYRATSRPYLIFGLLAERELVTPLGDARVFINAENIGNVRQTRFDPLVLATRGPGGRWTTDAWTELPGATVNGGVRFRF